MDALAASPDIELTSSDASPAMVAASTQAPFNAKESDFDVPPLDSPSTEVTAGGGGVVGPAMNGQYSTFTFFPKLPLELRRKIWVESFPKPRCVNLMRYQELHDPEEIEEIEFWRELANESVRDRFPTTLSTKKVVPKPCFTTFSFQFLGSKLFHTFSISIKTMRTSLLRCCFHSTVSRGRRIVGFSSSMKLLPPSTLLSWIWQFLASSRFSSRHKQFLTLSSGMKKPVRTWERKTTVLISCFDSCLL